MVSMPISHRLDDSIIKGVLELIDSSKLGIFFGTWNLTVHNDAVEAIIGKTKSLKYGASVFLPPPTDLILYEPRLRNEALRLYGITKRGSDKYVSDGKIVPRGDYSYADLFLIYSEHPLPLIDYLYKNVWKIYDFNSWNYFAPKPVKHMYYLRKLFENKILLLLEPNTHAKFLLTENGLYEGSGNFTYSGMKLNVEVYAFYLFNKKSLSDVVSFNIDKDSVVKSYQEIFYDRIDYLQKDVEFIKNCNKLAKKLKSLFETQVGADSDKLISEIDNLLLELGRLRRTVWSKKGAMANILRDMPFSFSNQTLNNVKFQITLRKDKRDYSKIKESLQRARKIIESCPKIDEEIAGYLHKKDLGIEDLSFEVESSYFERLEEIIENQTKFMGSFSE